MKKTKNFYVPRDLEIKLGKDGVTFTEKSTGYIWTIEEIGYTKRPTKDDITSGGKFENSWPPRRIKITVEDVI
jgi:hypothetical protein